MRKYQVIDPLFVDKFLSSIYVDAVSLGSSDVESTYELYLKSKSRLAKAGFKLRKFVTNSDELRSRVDADCPGTPLVNVKEEDQGAKLVDADGTQDIGGPVGLHARYLHIQHRRRFPVHGEFGAHEEKCGQHDSTIFRSSRCCFTGHSPVQDVLSMPM